MTRYTLALAASTIGAATLLLLSGGPATAHVTVSPSSATAGSSSLLTFQIPHGCEGSKTTKITIHMPDDVVEATPTRNPMYTVSKETKRLDEPIAADDGDEITEKVDTVTYTAIEPLPDGFRDALEILIDIPDGMAGQRLSFPTIQTCQQGQTAWTQIPAAGQDPDTLDKPAPGLDVLPADSVTGARSGPTAPPSAGPTDDGPDGWGYAGAGLGVVALGLGAVAIARTRKPS